MAVALPDICGALQSENGKALQERYESWCHDNLKAGFENWTPKDLYSLRCGMLHQGRVSGLKHGVKRVVLMPKGRNRVIDCMSDDGTSVYSVVEFCLNMNRAVVAWYEANQHDANVKRNMQELMQYRSGAHGVGGSTVIA